MSKKVNGVIFFLFILLILMQSEAMAETKLSPGFEGSSAYSLERIREKNIPNGSFYIKTGGYSFGGARVIARVNNSVAFDYIIPKKGEKGYGEDYFKDITRWIKNGRNKITLTFEQKSPLILSGNHGYDFIIGERIRNDSRTVFSFTSFGDALKLLGKTTEFTGDFDKNIPKNNLLGKELYVFKVSSYASPSIQLDVKINGRTIGSYIGHAQANISDYVIPGENRVEYTIHRLAEEIKPGKTIRDATIGIQKGRNYNTLVNYNGGMDELKQIKVGGSKKLSYTFIAPGAATGETKPSVAGKSRYKYYMETFNYGPVQSTVWINGVNIGSFSSSGNANVTGYIKPGENKVKIVVKKQGKITYRNRTGVKIFRKEKGRMNTVVNHEVKGGVNRDLMDMPEEKAFEYSFVD